MVVVVVLRSELQGVVVAERCWNARSAFVCSRRFFAFLMNSQGPSSSIRPLKAAASLPVEGGEEAMLVNQVGKPVLAAWLATQRAAAAELARSGLLALWKREAVVHILCATGLAQ